MCYKKETFSIRNGITIIIPPLTLHLKREDYIKMEHGKTFTNSIGMQFVKVEAGSFMMGSKKANLPDEIIGEKEYLRDGDWDEHPVHQVTISNPLYVGIYQVTNLQYEEFQHEHNDIRGKFGFSKEDDEAVVFVDWNDANNFCKMVV